MFARYKEDGRVLNARIRELCGVTKRVDERIDEGVLRPCGEDGE